jgi:hypothetical protein
MLKTNIAETVAPKDGTRKAARRAYTKRGFSASIRSVARDANNVMKLRAQNRAYEIGKTLTKVYDEAGVNRAYLSELPKTGWRQDKLQAIATALNWTVDELMIGFGSPSPSPREENGELLETAIQIAVELLRSIRSDQAAPKIGKLSRHIFEMLQDQASSGAPPLSDETLLICCRAIMKALMTPST